MGSNLKTNLYKNLNGFRQYFPNIEKPLLQTFIQICVYFIENHKFSPEILSKAIKKHNNSKNEYNTQHFMEMFAAVFTVMEVYLRQIKGNSKPDELKEILMDLKLPDDSIQSLCKVLSSHQQNLAENLYEIKSLKISSKNIDYRLNISLMESGINSRISQPSVVLQIHRRNDKSITFETSISNFHKLRYNLALLLKEIQMLEKRQIMKK